MKVLIIDDEELAIEDLKMTLTLVDKGIMAYHAYDHKAALELIKKENIKIVFSDIHMPGMDGIELAEKIKEIDPKINIIFTTAFSEHAVDAFELYASGYLLKPVKKEDLSEALNNLRYPVEEEVILPEIKCFGNFEIFYKGEPIKVQRKREKEVLAFLVDRLGASVSIEDMCETFFEESEDEEVLEKKKHLIRIVITDLKKDLKEYGIEDILVSGRNSYSIKVAAVKCDFFDYMDNPIKDIYFSEQYMVQYPWAAQRREYIKAMIERL